MSDPDDRAEGPDSERESEREGEAEAETEADPPPVEEHERLLAGCIEAFTRDGAAALEAVLAAHPAQAAALRARLLSLQRLGLLGEGAEPAGERRFGPYRVLRPLGQGGMSTVYLAFDERLQRRVALKTCHAPGVGDDRLRARFEREIHAVAQLQHPAVVPIFDVGEADGRPYFTMEYVRGATLDRLLLALAARGDRLADKDGASVRHLVHELARETDDDVGDGVRAAPGRESRKVPGAAPGVAAARAAVDELASSAAPWPVTWVEALVRWTADVAGALAQAHSIGIVHRDVKPANVIVGLDGHARLFDLGLARLLDRPALTRSGDFTGTPYYVAPEQLAGGKDVDGRSDVFSLGVTLYELLTLRRPFDGRSTAQVFQQIVDRDPPLPRRLDPTIPVELETICLTALEKDPRARYQGMGELAADLQRFLDRRPVLARPVGFGRRLLRGMRRRPALAAAGILALLVVVGTPLGLLWKNRAVADQRDLAEAAAGEARRQAAVSARVTDFLVDLFELDPQQIGRAESVTAREILDRGVQRIPGSLEDQPLARASLLAATGKVYRNLGAPVAALPLLDRALAIFQREHGEEHVETASLLAELARVHLDSGDARASLALCERSVRGFLAAGASASDGDVRCRLTLADAAVASGDPALAERRLDELLPARRALGLVDDALLADVLERLGTLAAQGGRQPLARERLLESLAIRRALWVPDPAALGRGLQALAAVHGALGEPDLAERAATEAGRLLAATGSPSESGAVPETAAPVPGAGSGPAAPGPAMPGSGAPELAARGAASIGPFELHPPWRAEFDAAAQRGVTALQSGRYDEAVQSFAHCVELDPGHAVSAYNLACAHALAGRVDDGLLWVERAVDRGFGFLVDGPPVMAQDPDLSALRQHERWEVLTARMLERRAEAEAFASEAALYVPQSAPPGTPRPLLVVLHADGATKDAVVAGPWREVAEATGSLLLAPSARTPTGRLPHEGMRWFRDVDDFVERPWAFEEPVLEAVRRACQELDVDRARVTIVGEGLGGLLAADLAFIAPGLFGGVLVVNGPVQPDLSPDRARIAALLGLRVHVLLDPREALAGAPAGTAPDVLARAVEDWLALWLPAGQGTVGLVDPARGASAVDVRLAALRELHARGGT